MSGPEKIEAEGFEMKRKTATKSKGASSCHIYLPPEWENREVIVILKEEPNEED